MSKATQGKPTTDGKKRQAESPVDSLENQPPAKMSKKQDIGSFIRTMEKGWAGKDYAEEAASAMKCKNKKLAEQKMTELNKKKANIESRSKMDNRRARENLRRVTAIVVRTLSPGDIESMKSRSTKNIPTKDDAKDSKKSPADAKGSVSKVKKPTYRFFWRCVGVSSLIDEFEKSKNKDLISLITKDRKGVRIPYNDKANASEEVLNSYPFRELRDDEEYDCSVIASNDKAFSNITPLSVVAIGALSYNNSREKATPFYLNADTISEEPEGLIKLVAGQDVDPSSVLNCKWQLKFYLAILMMENDNKRNIPPVPSKSVISAMADAGIFYKPRHFVLATSEAISASRWGDEESTEDSSNRKMIVRISKTYGVSKEAIAALNGSPFTPDKHRAADMRVQFTFDATIIENVEVDGGSSLRVIYAPVSCFEESLTSLGITDAYTMHNILSSHGLYIPFVTVVTPDVNKTHEMENQVNPEYWVEDDANLGKFVSTGKDVDLSVVNPDNARQHASHCLRMHATYVGFLMIQHLRTNCPEIPRELVMRKFLKLMKENAETDITDLDEDFLRDNDPKPIMGIYESDVPHPLNTPGIGGAQQSYFNLSQCNGNLTERFFTAQIDVPVEDGTVETRYLYKYYLLAGGPKPDNSMKVIKDECEDPAALENLVMETNKHRECSVCIYAVRDDA